MGIRNRFVPFYLGALFLCTLFCASGPWEEENRGGRGVMVGKGCLGGLCLAEGGWQGAAGDVKGIAARRADAAVVEHPT